MVNCTYLDFTLNSSIFSLNSTINIDNLQNIVDKMATMNMCAGVHIPIEQQKFKSKLVTTDSNGKFRHLSCLLINTNRQITQCRYCRTILNTLNRNKQRSKLKNTVKRINL